MTLRTDNYTREGFDGQPLSIDLRYDDAVPVTQAVLVCHGFKGFKDWGFFPYVSEQLVRGGTAVVTFNFSHNGVGDDPTEFTRLDLFERNTYAAELSDFETVKTWLRQESEFAPALGQAPLGVVGHSRGGLVAMVASAEDPSIVALATWAGVGHALRYTDRQLAQWEAEGTLEFTNARTGQRMALGFDLVRDSREQSERYDLFRAAQRMEAAHLIVHGTADMAVPVDEAKVLQADRKPPRCRVELIERATHTFGAVHPFEGTTPHLEQLLDVTNAWFDRWLR